MSGDAKPKLYVVGDDDVDGALDGGGPADPPLVQPIEFSDDALASELSRALGEDWVYTPASDEWFRWDGMA